MVLQPPSQYSMSLFLSNNKLKIFAIAIVLIGWVFFLVQGFQADGPSATTGGTSLSYASGPFDGGQGHLSYLDFPRHVHEDKASFRMIGSAGNVFVEGSVCVNV